MVLEISTNCTAPFGRSSSRLRRQPPMKMPIQAPGIATEPVCNNNSIFNYHGGPVASMNGCRSGSEFDYRVGASLDSLSVKKISARRWQAFLYLRDHVKPSVGIECTCVCSYTCLFHPLLSLLVSIRLVALAEISQENNIWLI